MAHIKGFKIVFDPSDENTQEVKMGKMGFVRPPSYFTVKGCKVITHLKFGSK